MVEIAEELVEAVHGRQVLVQIAKVVLAELPGGVAQRLPQLGDRGVLCLQADVSALGASLLPIVENLRASSATAAIAVARAAADDGVATKKIDHPVQAVQDAMWQPVYPEGAA